MAGYRGASSSSAAGGGGAVAFATRVLLLLTLLPLVLQWRGGMRDPTGVAWPADTQRFPGMVNSPLGSSSKVGRGSYFAVSSAAASSVVASSAAAHCAEILSRSASSTASPRGASQDLDAKFVKVDQATLFDPVLV
jgi:hypothetical protein